MGFKRMVDMQRSPDEKIGGYDAPALLEGPDYPSGLCLTLTERELAKLDLDDDCEPGDLLHLKIMAKATHVSKGDGTCTISMQVVAMAIEDESSEGDGASDGD